MEPLLLKCFFWVPFLAEFLCGNNDILVKADGVSLFKPVINKYTSRLIVICVYQSYLLILYIRAV